MSSPLLIFDCDGVLVDSETINTSEFHAMALQDGINISFESLHQEMLGGALYKAIELLEKQHNKKLREDFIDEFRKRTFERFKNELQPIEGILPSLHKLTHNKCIASNGPVEKMKLNLAITNVLSHFNENHIYSAYQINKWKPEPDLFLFAAQNMQTVPQQCIVIEDSANGVLAAQQAGMKVIAYATAAKKEELNKLKPTLLIDNMYDLHESIQFLTKQL